MLTDYSLKMPKEVYGGEHALEKLKDVMSVNDVKKVAVFTDHGKAVDVRIDDEAEITA